ncbi:hypothetical protein AGMMS50267_02220 [Spirochaetia bacterium]|nr:hypothetical protein AGMMS50267_02220 [Spirochaetia bacterium]
MNKRYQVFISSTYADLAEERRYVMQALMEMDCIPAGMELFPAVDEEQWEYIKKAIDECDYYLLIIGGRYGSTTNEGISYTEKEFDYAVGKGLKTICLIHKNPGQIPFDKSEKTPEMQKKLKEFCEKAKKGRLVKHWEKPEELQSLAISSLTKTIKLYPAIGYVRADLVPDENAVTEILKLRDRIIELEGQLNYAANNAPLGSDIFSQGDDLFNINFIYCVSSPKSDWDIGILLTDDSKYYKHSIILSWNTIFSAVSPLMVYEAEESLFKKQVNTLLYDKTIDQIKKKKELAKKEISEFEINDSDFQTIKVQLKALGLITKSLRNRSVNDKGTYWTLTPYGDNVMTRLIAIKKM